MQQNAFRLSGCIIIAYNILTKNFVYVLYKNY